MEYWNISSVSVLLRYKKVTKERTAKASWVFHSIINVSIFILMLNVFRSHRIHNCCKDANHLSTIAKRKVFVVPQKKKGKHKKRGWIMKSRVKWRYVFKISSIVDTAESSKPTLKERMRWCIHFSWLALKCSSIQKKFLSNFVHILNCVQYFLLWNS